MASGATIAPWTAWTPPNARRRGCSSGALSIWAFLGEATQHPNSVGPQWNGESCDKYHNATVLGSTEQYIPLAQGRAESDAGTRLNALPLVQCRRFKTKMECPNGSLHDFWTIQW